MSGDRSPATPAGRDAALRRLRILNRVLIGSAVAATGLLADVAAKAFPGHRRVVHAPAAAVTRSRVTGSGHATRRHPRDRPGHVHRTHGAHRGTLAPPAQAPSAPAASTPAPAASTQAAPATTPAPPATPQPAAPAPAPVTSGGS